MKKGTRIIATLLSLTLMFVGISVSDVARVKADDGGGARTISVDLSDGSVEGQVVTYTIGEATVTITFPGTVVIAEGVAALPTDTEFSVAGYDSSSMLLKGYTSDGMMAELAVTNNTSKLDARISDGGWPDNIKLAVVARNNGQGGQGGEGGQGGQGGDPGFNGTAYFLWQGSNDKICIHEFSDLLPGCTDAATNYIDVSVVKDDVTNESFTMDKANTAYWLWSTEGLEQFAGSYSAFQTYIEKRENESFKRSIAIDPCGFENSAGTVGTFGDRNFRARIYDEDSYQGLVFCNDVEEYTYFPEWWDVMLFTGVLDISGTSEANPAIYEAFSLEKTLKLSNDSYSKDEITSISPVGVPAGAVTVTNNEGEWEITFNSNFYDHVTFKVATASGSYYFQIQRTAIQVCDNWGPETAEADQAFICSLYYDDSESASDYEVYATIYYEDGSKKLEKLTVKEADQSGGTKLKRSSYEVKSAGVKGISFNAVKAGALSGTNFGGIYLGSDDGTYYDPEERCIVY